MRNMKAICTKLACFLLVLSMSSAAMAESITSPKWTTSIKLLRQFSSEPVMNFLQGKAVIKPQSWVWN